MKRRLGSRLARIGIAAALLCGCSNNADSQTDAAVISVSVSSSSTAESSSSSAAEENTDSIEQSLSDSPDESSSDCGEPHDDGQEDAPSYKGIVWDYPINEELSYDFASGNIVRGLEERYGKTGADLEYYGEWCAMILSDLLIRDGYEFEFQYNPCDLTIQLLDNEYAHFYCLREENFDSLVYWGLQNTDRVIMTSYEDFTPKRGDIICYLWTEDVDIYNWSHIGMVAADYDSGGLLYTIEGNIGQGADPLYHAVEARIRNYDSTVVGFIRLD